MEAMTRYLPAICALLLVLLLILLIVLLVKQKKDRQERHGEADRQQRALEEMQWRLMDDLDRQREENEDSLNELNDRLLNTLNSIGGGQTTLLESMQRQILMSTRNQDERNGQMSEELSRDLSRMDNSVEQLRRSMQGAMADLREENDRQLAEIRRNVDDKLTESLDRKLNASFTQVSKRLEELYRSLGEVHDLAGGVNDLKRVLTNVKTRGIWGEIQLGNLISQILSPGQYETNCAVVPGSQERVEFAIVLPGRDEQTVRLPIDSKFPQEDYLRLTEASAGGDAAGVAEARRKLAKRIRDEAKRISSKYIAPPDTTDYAIMFLPVEALYAEVVQSPDLVEEIQREQRVVIAGPGTFAAMLNALQMGFRTLAIEKRTGEVWQLLGEVRKDFEKFADSLEKTRQRLQQASESIDATWTRTRSLQKRLKAVENSEGLLTQPETEARPEPDETEEYVQPRETESTQG